MNLAETQRLFWAALEGEVSAAALGDCFVGTADLSAQARVHLYADMVLFRQVDALRADFPFVAALLGDRPFFLLARDYVRAHPSESPDLGMLGRKLAAFVGNGNPGLGDLAALEWARAEVFFAASAVPLLPDALSGLEPERFGLARLALAPALQLLELDHDAPAAWMRLKDGESDVVVEARKTFVVAWRKGFEVHHAPLLPDEAHALRLAQAGATLAEICAAFAEREDPAATAFEALASWLADEWVAAIG